MSLSVERLRRIWSPGHEVEEVVAALEPASELDSMVRDWLHRIVQQKGPVTLHLGNGDMPLLNTGTLRYEIVEHEPKAGVRGRRELSLWVEEG